jgi:ABC-type transport system involved in multi-copper enzyme maturation permease subunit
MIWLTWRQFRWQAITAAAALGAVAILLAATGPHLAALFSTAGLKSCDTSCGKLASNFLDSLHGLDIVIFEAAIVVMYLVPALIGIFWGGPLIAREFETGTHRLAWNQSVSRTRWTAVKLGLIGAAAVATAGLLSLMIGWWASPIDHAMTLGQSGVGNGNHFPRLSPLVFAARGVAPLGYAAFAFALGVTAGVLIRKTLPAMAVTLAVFAAVQFLMPTFVRPHLITPVQVTAPFNANNNNQLMIGGPGGSMTVVGNFSRPGAWILSNNTITRSGKVFTGPATAACTGNGSPQDCINWLNSLRLRQQVSYQPASRFWPLQGIETGIYLILAAGLTWLCLWQVRRRRA